MASTRSNRQQLFLVLLALACTAGACAPIEAASPAITDPPSGQNTPASAPTTNGPIVSPYVDVVVTGVEVRKLPTQPVRVELVIRGTLPDQCKYRFIAVDHREGQQVRVQLRAMHPAEQCDPTVQSIEYVLPLERNMPESKRGFAPGTYELTINDYQTTFSITG